MTKTATNSPMKRRGSAGKSKDRPTKQEIDAGLRELLRAAEASYYWGPLWPEVLWLGAYLRRN
jgi:hypothetical protein